MKILTVYYSKTGKTEIVAQELAQYLNADLEKITEIKPKSGIIGNILDGKDAALEKSSPINEIQHQITNYDLIIIGTPIWAWNMSNPIRGFLERYKQDIKKVAFFATMGGSGDQRAFLQMAKITCKTPIVTTSFLDYRVKNGNYKEDLREFANSIKNIFNRVF